MRRGRRGGEAAAQIPTWQISIIGAAEDGRKIDSNGGGKGQG